MEYRFYTDTDRMNLMDENPFHVVKLDAIEHGIEVLETFQKDVFSPVSIREYATELTYTAKIFAFLVKQLDIQDGELSDSFVDWILHSENMYDGRVTSNAIERFKPIAKISLKRVISRIVRRVVTEIDAGVSAAPPPHLSVDESSVESEKSVGTIEGADVGESDDGAVFSHRKEIVTTEEELECFAIIKKIFESSTFASRRIYEPSMRSDVPLEIGYKDTTAYFNVYFNKPSWWNMRLCLDGKNKWVAFDIDPESGSRMLPENFEIMPPTAHASFRVKINNSHDIYTLTELVYASFEKTIQDREKVRNKE
jgi:predicted type IV restriction endonuclease